MRVVECNICGETISAANDEELAGLLKTHLADEHDEEPSDDEIHQKIDHEAYDAMDS